MITVTAAIIHKDNKIFAARRQTGCHLAGYWEFPGGKIEPGETEQECLRRELLEEFTINCTVDSFFMESIYDYTTKVIRLRSYLVSHLSGAFKCTAHDQILWLPPWKLHTLKWAPADIPIVEMVQKTMSK